MMINVGKLHDSSTLKIVFHFIVSTKHDKKIYIYIYVDQKYHL